MSLALLDTTLLSNFAHVERPDLLHLALAEEAATTPAILREIRSGETLQRLPAYDWEWLPVLHPTDDERRQAEQWHRQLDPGEAECLAVALRRGGRFLSDDRAARRLARHLGVPVSGTLGVLQVLVLEQHLTMAQADELLSGMLRHGFRSPVRSIQDLLSPG